MDKLKSVCLSNFIPFVNSIKKMEPHHYGLLFNYSREKEFGESYKSYLGKQLCGEACYSLKKILEDNNYTPLVKYNTRTYGSFIDDHCFIKIDDIIVDPTYRQFLLEYSKRDKEDYIFDKLDPFFIGSKNELLKIIDKCNILDDISYYWDVQKDVTDKFN